jgi:hypothetical protein
MFRINNTLASNIQRIVVQYVMLLVIAGGLVAGLSSAPSVHADSVNCDVNGDGSTAASETGITTTKCLTLFDRQCVFPIEKIGTKTVTLPDNTTTTVTTGEVQLDSLNNKVYSCPPEKSIVGGIILFLRGVIPYLAILVVIWGGYQYYSSSLGGDYKKSQTAIHSGIMALVLLLVIDLVNNLYDKIGINPASAQGGGGAPISGAETFFRVTLWTSFIINPILEVMRWAAGAMTVVALLHAAYLYINGGMSGGSGGNEAAKKSVLTAVIGLLVVILGTSVIGLVQNLLSSVQ